MMSPHGLEQIQLCIKDHDQDPYSPDRDVVIGGIPGLLVHGTGGRYWSVRQSTNATPVQVNCWQQGEILHLTYFFPWVSLKNFPPQ